MPSPELPTQFLDESLTYLKQLSESALRDKVVRPYFEQLGWKTESVCRRDERHHRCDILMNHSQDATLLFGSQLKARVDIRGSRYVQRTIEQHAAAAFRYLHATHGNRALTRYIWITSGDVDRAAKLMIHDLENNHALLAGRTEVWCGRDLVEKIWRAGFLDLLRPLQRYQFEHWAEQHQRLSEWAFSSYCWFKTFEWQVQHNAANREAARQSLSMAATIANELPTNSPYYARTLKLNIALWQQLFELGFSPRPSYRPAQVASLREAAAEINPRYGNLAVDLIGIHHQFRLLQEFQQVTYASLAALRTTRMLLRSGVSPRESATSAYLDIIRAELETEDRRSLDGKCSLCTGHAISCLSLAGLSAEVIAPINWLTALETFRFCWLEGSHANIPPQEHALHYAASALQGVVDSAHVHNTHLQQLKEADLTNAIINTLFTSNTLDVGGWPKEWIKYRNIDRTEVCRIIFSTFLHMRLVGISIDPTRASILKEFTSSYIENLLRDVEYSTEPERFYSIRENLSTFCLGMLLGLEPAEELARRVVRILRLRSDDALTSGRGGRMELWDSNIDRTQIRVEGALQYWETLLCMEKASPGAAE